MRRDIPLLRGFAMVAVLVGHSAARALTDRYLPEHGVAVQLSGWPLAQYWLLTSINQLTNFAVPAFFFITGIFVTYAVRPEPSPANWKFVRGRLKSLLAPFLIWSAIAVLEDVALRQPLGWPYWRSALRSGGVTWGYYFVPALMQFYLLAPLVVRWAAKYPWRTLGVAVTIELASMVMLLVGQFWGLFSTIPGVGSHAGFALATRWIAFFVLGVCVAPHASAVSAWLKSHRKTVAAITCLLGAAAVFEGQYLSSRLLDMAFILTQHRIFLATYSVSAMALFLSFDIPRGRLSRALEKLGAVSFGVYLVHPLVLKGLYRVMQHFAPAFLDDQPVAAFAIYFVIGLSTPWAAIEYLQRTRLRPVAFHVFGR